MTFDENGLMRVVYFSRNRIEKPLEQMKWDIDAILEVSQANNARVGVTGALVFNRGVFGQVLEGPIEAVEETFERIQSDPRHHDVTVLEIRKIETLSFSQWDMGFVGSDEISSRIFADVRADRAIELSRARAEAVIQQLQALAMRNELRKRAA